MRRHGEASQHQHVVVHKLVVAVDRNGPESLLGRLGVLLLGNLEDPALLLLEDPLERLFPAQETRDLVDAVAGDAGAQRVAVSTVEVGNTVGETVGLDFEAKAAGELHSISKHGLVPADRLGEDKRIVCLVVMPIRVEQAGEHSQTHRPRVVQVARGDALDVGTVPSAVLSGLSRSSAYWMRNALISDS